MKFDLMTLSIVVSGVSLIATLTLYSLKQVMPKHPSIHAWLISGVLGTLSFIAVLLFGWIGNTAFSIHHVLSLISLHFLLKGATFLDEKRRRKLGMIDALFLAYVFLTAWLLRDDLTARYIAYDSMAVILLALTFYRLYVLSERGRFQEYTVALGAYGIGVFAFAYHLYLAIIGGFTNDPEHPYNEILLVLITFVISAWTYGNILIIQRLVQRSIEDKIRIDDLTGVLNRRGIHDMIHRLVAADRRFSLYVIDLNDFKAVNDTYGHLNGDRMLQEYARALKKAMATKGHVARVGGDEFIVVSPGIHEDAPIPLDSVIHVEGEPVRLKASVGKAVYPTEGRTLERLLQVADEAMYDQKAAMKRPSTEETHV